MGSARFPRYRYMGKRTATRWYLGAWFIWVVAVIAFGIAYQHVDRTDPSWFRDPNLAGLATILWAAVLVMAITWIGTLLRLARQHDWGWFGALLVLQLVGLGIAGMAAYAIAGPVDIDLSRPGIE